MILKDQRRRSPRWGLRIGQVVPLVIDKEGLGYYGIQLTHLSCTINGPQAKPLGRLTMAGDVENWRTGGPGDHGLELTEKCDAGLDVNELTCLAIRHLAIPPNPAKSHLNCRHKRWGQSYELVFTVAAILALRNDGEVSIANSEHETNRLIESEDPKSDMNEHMGGFIFRYDDATVLISGDGRFLKPDRPEHLRQRYMEGETPYRLALDIEEELGLR